MNKVLRWENLLVVSGVFLFLMSIAAGRREPQEVAIIVGGLFTTALVIWTARTRRKRTLWDIFGLIVGLAYVVFAAEPVAGILNEIMG